MDDRRGTLRVTQQLDRATGRLETRLRRRLTDPGEQFGVGRIGSSLEMPVATYRLVPIAGGPPVAAGSVRTVTGYSAPASEASSAFASRAAERDAEERLAVTLADQIVERLALTSATWVGPAS